MHKILDICSSIPLFKSKDDMFINAAYLSELWAVKDLLRFKNHFPEQWNEFRENQLNDEIRHANNLLKQLKNNNEFYISDVKYSIQERIYKIIIDLNLTADPINFSIVHEMTELRALFIYKTYLKLRPNSSYKNILQEIIKDEENHFSNENHGIKNSFMNHALINIDRYLFHRYLPNKFGKKIFENKSFWHWYYNEIDTESISLFSDNI